MIADAQYENHQLVFEGSWFEPEDLLEEIGLRKSRQRPLWTNPISAIESGRGSLTMGFRGLLLV